MCLLVLVIALQGDAIDTHFDGRSSAVVANDEAIPVHREYESQVTLPFHRSSN